MGDDPDEGDVLSAHDLTVTLGGALVLDHVNVRVAPGEFVGLIGSNGAGKTTLLRVLLGSLPSGGQVVRPSSSHGLGGIGYLPQKVDVAPDIPLRVRDVVALGADGGHLGLPLHRKAIRGRVADVLDAVGATDFADQRIGELSGGQQQRALLAHALMGSPSLLLLDEPLANLDPASAHDIVDLLDALRHRTHVAIVMTAHDMNLLLPVMDRLIYLAEGRAASGRPDEVVRDDVLTALYGRPMRVVHVEGRAMVFADADGQFGADEVHHADHHRRAADEVMA